MPESKNFVRALGFLAILLSTCASALTEDTFYQVELIVFANNSQSAESEEYWPNEITLTYPDNLIALPENTPTPDQEAFSNQKEQQTPQTEQEEHLPNNFEQKIEHQPFQFLTDALKHLKRSSRYRILFAESWIQPINHKATYPFIYISGGKTINGHTELAGAIQLHVERFLHINTHIWLVDFIQGVTDVVPVEKAAVDEETQAWLWPIPPENPLHETHEAEPETLFSFNETPETLLSDVIFNDTEDNTAYTLAYTLAIKKIGVINSRTRLKSRDIHYIDHPLFGLLIKVTPYKKLTETVN